MTIMTIMSTNELNELTTMIDTYNYDNNDKITPENLHHVFWEKINRLRNASNRKILLHNWKYTKELESAELSEINNKNKNIHITNENDNAEYRFILEFWLSIYH
jgi:hypothetical protein